MEKNDDKHVLMNNQFVIFPFVYFVLEFSIWYMYFKSVIVCLGGIGKKKKFFICTCLKTHHIHPPIMMDVLFFVLHIPCSRFVS